MVCFVLFTSYRIIPGLSGSRPLAVSKVNKLILVCFDLYGKKWLIQDQMLTFWNTKKNTKKNSYSTEQKCKFSNITTTRDCMQDGHWTRACHTCILSVYQSNTEWMLYVTITSKQQHNAKQCIIHGVEWVTPASFSTLPTNFSGKYCSTTMVPFAKKRIRMATRRPAVVGSWTTQQSNNHNDKSHLQAQLAYTAYMK